MQKVVIADMGKSLIIPPVTVRIPMPLGATVPLQAAAAEGPAQAAPVQAAPVQAALAPAQAAPAQATPKAPQPHSK